MAYEMPCTHCSGTLDTHMPECKFYSVSPAAELLSKAPRFDRATSSRGAPERDSAIHFLRWASATALRTLAGWSEDSGTPIEIRDELERVKHLLSAVDDLQAMKSLRKD